MLNRMMTSLRRVPANTFGRTKPHLKKTKGIQVVKKWKFFKGDSVQVISGNPLHLIHPPYINPSPANLP